MLMILMTLIVLIITDYVINDNNMLIKLIILHNEYEVHICI